MREQLRRIIPYQCENFITFPLWEEGRFTPYIHIWQVKEHTDYYKSRLEMIFNNTGYTFFCEEDTDVTIKITIHPIEFNFNDYLKPKWSIEEMLDLIIKFLEDE